MREQQHVVVRVPALPEVLSVRLPDLVRAALGLISDGALIHFRRRWMARADLLDVDVSMVRELLRAAWGFDWYEPRPRVPPSSTEGRLITAEAVRLLHVRRVQWVADLLESASVAALTSPLPPSASGLTPAQRKDLQWAVGVLAAAT